VLERLDQFVKHFYEPEEFVTVQLAVLDPASGTLELVSAGHPPPVVVDADHAKFVDVDAARALGVSAAPLAARPLRFALDPGAALVLYTDGLVERRGAALRTLGDGVVNLLGLALPAAGASAEALCDMVIDACLRGVSRDDDVCVLALMAKER
jgi:serine/threonine-protein kinase RsbW